MARQFLVLFILVVISDSVAAVAGACILWRIRKEFALAKYAGILLAAIAWRQVAEIVAGWGDVRVQHTPWYIIWWLAGRIPRAVAVWMVLLFLIGVLRNGKVEHDAR